MAGLGRKVWTNETLSVEDLQDYLQDQAVMRFASAAARSAAIPAPTEGMVTTLDDVNGLYRWDPGAAAWLPVGASFGFATATLASTSLAAGTSTTLTSGSIPVLAGQRLKLSAMVQAAFTVANAQTVSLGTPVVVSGTATRVFSEGPVGARQQPAADVLNLPLRQESLWDIAGGPVVLRVPISAGSGNSGISLSSPSMNYELGHPA